MGKLIRRMQFGIFYLRQDTPYETLRAPMSLKKAEETIQFGVRLGHILTGAQYLLDLKSIPPEEFKEKWDWLTAHDPADYDDAMRMICEENGIDERTLAKEIIDGLNVL